MNRTEQLRETLQGALSENDEDLDGALLKGFVIVAEWADPAGKRWITRCAGDLTDEGPPDWTIKGWLYHALNRVVQQRVDDA